MEKFCVHLLIFSAGLLILSCGVVKGQKTLEEDLDTPFSEQLDLLSKQESLFLKGRFGGPMMAVTKPIIGMDLRRYTTFDNSVVFISHMPDSMANEYTGAIRRLVAEESGKYGFTLVDHKESQAGIACVLAPFRAEGKMAFELIVIVFEREKSKNIMNESPNIRGLPLVFKAAIWYVVSRYYPEGDIVLDRGPTDKEISMTLQKLFDGTFRRFKMTTEGK